MKSLFTLFFILIASNSFAQQTIEKSLISVNGKSEMYVKPDEVTVRLAVEVNDKDINLAQTKNDEITNKVIKFTRDQLKVDEKFIKTNYINVTPVYEYRTCKTGDTSCQNRVFTHFTSQKGIEIKLSDTTLLQKLIQGALEAGVTNIDGIEFTSSETDKIKYLAYAEAAKDARKNADNITSALGVKTGAPHRINVSYYYPPQRPQPMMMAKAAYADSAPAAPESISVGQIEIRAEVSVDFEIIK